MQFIRRLREYRYEFVAFLTGAAVMVLEIVGARLIAPQFGTSTYVWTAMIGVILGALAIGYAIGGKLADRYHSSRFLAKILFFAAVLVLITGIYQEPVLRTIAGWGLDLRLSALLAATVLFAPPSLLVGMVSPHLAKVRITSLDTTGRSVGRLEAAGALGSIAGTFLCGYFLLGAFGSRTIVIGIVLLLLATSFTVEPRAWRKPRLIGIAIAILAWPLVIANPPAVLADVDTPYSRYKVISGYYGTQPVRALVADTGGIQSAVPANGSDELVLSYVQKFYQAAVAYGAPDKVLMIGGGAYTFPAALAVEFPAVRVDVAEIDAGLDKLARQYFHYQDSPRVRIHHMDGRAYLNSARERYDMVFMDAFSSQSPPFQLTTRETVQRIADNLTPDGVVVVNLISKYRGGNDPYLRAVRNTYAAEFQRVAVYQTVAGRNLEDPQNFQLIASNDNAKFAALDGTMCADALSLAPGGLVLTDNYAPIERLTYY